MYPYNIPIDMDNSVEEDGKQKCPVVPNKKILELILCSIKVALRNISHYERLAAEMTCQEDAELIRHMGLDEKKHEKLFSDIYYFLTGEKPEIETPEAKELFKDTVTCFQRCMFDELKEVELNRVIHFSFLNMAMRDMLYEIMTDEQAHAVKFGYLFAKYHGK